MVWLTEFWWVTVLQSEAVIYIVSLLKTQLNCPAGFGNVILHGLWWCISVLVENSNMVSFICPSFVFWFAGACHILIILMVYINWTPFLYLNSFKFTHLTEAFIQSDVQMRTIKAVKTTFKNQSKIHYVDMF